MDFSRQFSIIRWSWLARGDFPFKNEFLAATEIYLNDNLLVCP